MQRWGALQPLVMTKESFHVTVALPKELSDQFWADFLRLINTYSLKFVVTTIAHAAYVAGRNSR